MVAYDQVTASGVGWDDQLLLSLNAFVIAVCCLNQCGGSWETAQVHGCYRVRHTELRYGYSTAAVQSATFALLIDDLVGDAVPVDVEQIWMVETARRATRVIWGATVGVTAGG